MWIMEGRLICLKDMMFHFGKIGRIFFACIQIGWTMPMQNYVVCSPVKPSAIIKKWAKNIELELELFDNILIKKCAKEAKREEQPLKVDVFIEIINKDDLDKGHAEIRVYAKNQIILLRDLSEMDLNPQGGVRFVNEVRKKIESITEANIQIFQETNSTKTISVDSHGEKLDDSFRWHEKASQLDPNTQENILKTQQRHWFVSTRLGGESFGYDFYPKDIEETIPAIKTKIIPRFGIETEWWPYPWIGLNANGSFALSVFRMEVNELYLFESKIIWAQHYQGESTLKMRYHFANGLALGLSSGYWHQTGIVDVQTVDKKIYTQLPSFHLHALEIGPELYYGSIQKSVDITLHARALPFVSYQENPDIPGQEGKVFGMHAQLLFRYFFANNNWFLIFQLQGMCLYGVFQGYGNRVTPQNETMQGGTLLNYTLNTSAGIGWSL
jgi:hypothetical protein